jgi:arabinogalactan endo-1,4-beta-galactosidase
VYQIYLKFFWNKQKRKEAKLFKRLLYLCLIFFLSGVFFGQIKTEEDVSSEPPMSKESVSGFVKGGDISLLQRIDDSGYEYKSNGQSKDALEIFKEHGFNYMRLRLFHTPSGRGPVVNSLEYTIKLAKRIKKGGFKFLLDFHYSDTWADPGHQIKPKAWEGLPFPELERAVYEYTKDVVTKLNEEWVLPDMVQVGNEITPGFLWDEGRIYKKDEEANWKDFTTLLKAGVKGVKDAIGKDDRIEIMVHVDNGGSKERCRNFYDKMLEYDVPFDVIGVSYYPWWHGTMEDLKENLTFLSKRYDKDVYVVEAAYPWRGWYPDPERKNLTPPFPVSKEGQAEFFKELFQTATNTQGGKVKGVFYWAPEWVAVEGVGRNWAGRAMFDEDGRALPVFDVFKEN